MQLAMLACEALADVTLQGLAWVWQQCDGIKKAERRLARFEKQGLICVAPGAEALARVVRLTDAGRLAAMGGRDPEEWWSRPWDGKWRLVVFDVPERNEALRTRLRRQLRALHFGYLQNSVWISPDSLSTLQATLTGQQVDVETLILLEAQPCGGESNQDLVAGSWAFDELDEMYAAYEDILRRRPLGSINTPGRRAAWRQWLQREWHAWQRVTRHDPFLPEALLPAGYRGKRAWAERLQVLRSIPLRPPAHVA